MISFPLEDLCHHERAYSQLFCYRLKDVPDCLATLHNLSMLWLDHNDIKHIPVRRHKIYKIPWPFPPNLSKEDQLVSMRVAYLSG